MNKFYEFKIQENLFSSKIYIICVNRGVNMDKHEKLNYLFDTETRDSIIDFAKKITDSHADIYITMSRKAACFVDF